MASNKMLIDASHPEETRVVVLRGNRIEEFDFESQNKRQLKGNIYLAKVTRVEPSLQAAFVDYGGNRHGFLAFNEIHPDYYQIPVADRQALLEEEAAEARRELAEDDAEPAQATRPVKSARADDDESGEADEAKAEPKSKRRQRRPRRKSAVSKASSDAPKSESGDIVNDDDNDGIGDSETVALKNDDKKSDAGKPDAKAGQTASSEEPEPDSGENADALDDEGNSDPQDKPVSIAAIMETDSISEPAPDEEPSADSDEPDESEKSEAKAEASAKKPGRSTRRPRKKAKVEAEPEVPSDVPSDVETSNEQEKSETEAETSAKTEIAETQTADGDDDAEEAPKPKTRRRRRSTQSRSRASGEDDSGEASDPENGVNENGAYENGADENGTNDNGDSDIVESTGQEDVLEEVPQRRRPRRHYKIQEVVKRRQVLLVQVVKEERGNKGAALTTYLSLAGRYSVLMPNTARGGGISRKITNAADRKRLKTIATELEVPEGMGVILRTAGASRTKAEIQRDFEYLMRLWENVRNLTLSSSAPCLVYEEGSLIKRSIRDLYDKNTGEVLVAGEAGHREAQDFMEMLMPSHAKKVKLYRDEQAMFARFGVEQKLDKMLSHQVTLKSGGYLVIDQTEALVAIDVNSGRATREHSIEDTALQTNLETAEEVARQLRLRDLAGLIVIDFIDMEEKRNNRAVEKKLKECLKHDRARIQVGRISHFGLMEMSRQRMRASVLDSTMDICPHCQGKGHLRSKSSVSLHILRSIEEHLLKNSRFDLVVKAASDIALYILNHKRQALMEIEERFGLKIFIEGNGDLLGENFTMEKGEPSTGERKPVTHFQAGQLSQEPDDDEAQVEVSDTQDDEEKTGKRKHRRRRGRNIADEAIQESGQETGPDSPQVSTLDNSGKEESGGEDEPGKRKRRRGKRAGRNTRKAADGQDNIPANIGEIQDTNTQSGTSSDKDATGISAPNIIENSEIEVTPTRRKRNSRPRKAKAPTAEAQPPETPIVSDDNSPPASEKSTETKSAKAKSARAKSAKAKSAEAKPSVSEEDKKAPSSEPPRPKRRTTRRRAATELVEEEPKQDPPEKAKVVAAKAEIQSDAATSQQSSPEQPAEDVMDKDKKRGGWWSRTGFFK